MRLWGRLSEERFNTVVAVLIALSTAMGAVVAWRAAVAGDGASNADADALTASVSAEEARVLNLVLGYQHYRAYTEYVRHNELGNAIYEALPSAPADEADALRRQMTEAWDVATGLQEFFQARYVTADSYDMGRELAAELADDARARNLDPDSSFAVSDRLRPKSGALIALLVPFAITLWLLTASETLTRWKVPLVAVGAALLGVSTVALIAIELTL